MKQKEKHSIIFTTFNLSKFMKLRLIHLKFSDKELVKGMLANDKRIIHYFLFEACTPMFGYIIKNIFDYKVDRDELINELYLYLHENEWYKLRQFDYRSKLTTWITVVAIRFFQKKRDELIEKDSDATLYIENRYETQDKAISKMDIENVLSKMPNVRYREVIHSLFIKDVEPQQLADKLGITVDNLYNVKRRAMFQLTQIVGKEVRYVR